MFEVIPPRPAPAGVAGIGGWIRRNLFSSPANTLLTVVTGLFVGYVVIAVVAWALFDASWGQVWANQRLFAVYRYPADLLWRPMAVLAAMMALIGVMGGAGRSNEILRGLFWSLVGFVAVVTVIAILFWPSARVLWTGVLAASVVGYALGAARPALVRALPWAWAAWLFLGFFLLYGVTPGSGLLRIVPARDWGGFMLTLILFTGIVPSFPLGVALALGRRSKLPAIKYTCIAFIEIVRGAPLIMWLFVASLLLPLFLNTDPNNLPAILRAYVAITLFSAAYMAENVRGGLQSVPRGQTEAARALGLGGWLTTSLIVLPQALRAVIPAIVGQAIGLFKDTSLVFIVGLADFFRVTEIVANQPASLRVTGGVKLELYLFVALIYFFFAYRMSIASRQLEKQLGVGTR
ncbi:MAG: amino acid ABC transporter permease [Trueperaceae bacterium]|nr:amino acid ABC transporter permease [Trueperaceae bacterium]